MTAITLRRLAGAAALVACTFAGALVPTTASALSYSDLVIFGDSLSDTGNLNILMPTYIPGTGQPYYEGRFSNGLIWTDYLAAGLGQGGDATSFQRGGNNYAFAGARTGSASSIDMKTQVDLYWGSSHAAADPDALYVLVGGGNDMRDARSVSVADGGSDASRQAAAEAAIANLKASMSTLADRGAKNVLISNLPDLAFSPEAFMLGKTSESADASARFNSLIGGLEAYGDFLGMDVDVLDMSGVMKQVRENPSVFGMTNVTLPCAGFTGSEAYGPGTATACSQSLFSDGLHPSNLAHQYLAQAAFTALGVTPVPEPETYALLLAGLAVVGAVKRRRTNKQAA